MSELTYLVDLTPAECAALLASSVLGRVGVVVNGRPEIFPVCHVYDLDTQTVVFPTNSRTKLDAALDWPFVAFEVDGISDDGRSGWSVSVVGHAETIDDPDEIARLSGDRHVVWSAGDTPEWLRIVPSKVSGRRISVPAPLVITLT